VINTLNDEQIKSLETGETLAVQINGEEAEIEPNDVLIQSKDIEGWLVANGNGLTVALDIQLDDDLINEGIAREMINRIQNLRKDAGFEVTDKIILYLKEDVALVKVFEKHQAYIQQETLAKEIVLKKNLVDGENKDLEEFKGLIEEKIEKAKEDLALLKSSYMNNGNNGTEDTSPTFKAFEEGSQTMSKEANTQLALRQEKFIRDLKNALIRIENKTYGVCRVTGKLIQKQRLILVPHATLSIEAKNMQK